LNCVTTGTGVENCVIFWSPILRFDFEIRFEVRSDLAKCGATGTCPFELTGAYRVIKMRKCKIFVSCALFFRRLSQERVLLMHS